MEGIGVWLSRYSNDNGGRFFAAAIGKTITSLALKDDRLVFGFDETRETAARLFGTNGLK